MLGGPAPWSQVLPCACLLPTGREASTINQLLMDGNLRKQNNYVEVGANNVRDHLQKVGGGMDNSEGPK